MATKKLEMIKGMRKLFKEKTHEDEKEIPEKERVSFTDPANVAMLIPKKPWVKSFIQENMDVTEGKVPELNYTEDKGRECSSKYSSEYMKVLLAMAQSCEALRLKVKNDYPLWAECDEFIYVLAPRVED